MNYHFGKWRFSPCSNNMSHTILGLDVGHGHVKGRKSVAQGVTTKIFYPSYAVPTVANGVGDNCITHGHRVMIAQGDASRFYVGEDVYLFTNSKDERALDEGFALSDGHLALIRGALSRAQCPVIDMLVVGLPMTTLASVGPRLKAKLQGAHPVPAYKSPVTGEDHDEVMVRRVEVLAQPLGAVIAAVREKKDLAKTRIATLDLGFNTFDALASNGVTPLPRRSGAVQGGLAAYIEEIQKSVEQVVRAEVPTLKGQYRAPAHTYEEALLARQDEILLSVGPIKLSDHLTSATARLEKDVERVFSIIGSPADMGAVVLAGGGAHLIKPILEKNYPEIRNIVIPENPQFAIADGYLLYGRTKMEALANG